MHLKSKIKHGLSWLTYLINNSSYFYIVTLLTLFISTAIFIGAQPCYADNPKFSKSYRQYPQGSPEAVVTALMEFDFMGGSRQAPETFEKWFPLTTNGEPDFNENSPYWLFAESPVITSYKVCNVEYIGKHSANVLVEVKMVAMYINKNKIKMIDKSYWPELSATIINDETNEAIQLKHPLRDFEFIHLISGSNMEDVFNKSIPGQNEIKVIKLLGERMKWRFKVLLVNRNSEWHILSDKLPYIHTSLESVIETTEFAMQGVLKNIEICSGKRPIPKGFYYDKASRCPPQSSPEKKFKQLSDDLAILNSLREENQ